MNENNKFFSESKKIQELIFFTLCNKYPELAWKIKTQTDDISKINDTFIAGVNIPTGIVTFCLDMVYWDNLNITTLKKPIESVSYKEENKKMKLKILRNYK